jgi:type III pantothenate kinase
MNLVLDFGNTRIKAGVFNGTELVERRFFDTPEEIADSVVTLLPIKGCIIGSVTKAHESIVSVLSAKFKTMVFTPESKIPFTNLYKSALTLGSDRLAASAGSYSFYPQRNVLTIDAGTCIKYNFVNSEDEYLGGAISPGVPMRLKAMHTFTAALPEVKADKSYTKLVGGSTTDSMLAGSLVAAACEADGMIDRYKETYSDLVVVITGGDGDYLCSQLKNRFFANQNILLHGLNTILQLNL